MTAPADLAPPAAPRLANASVTPISAALRAPVARNDTSTGAADAGPADASPADTSAASTGAASISAVGTSAAGTGAADADAAEAGGAGSGSGGGAGAGAGQVGAALSALRVARQALGELAALDAGALAVTEQAGCLRELEAAESELTAARAQVLWAFRAANGPADDGHGSARTWVRWQTRVTGGAADAAVAWARRLHAHPVIAQALASGQLSTSWARAMCGWSDLLPHGARGHADEILAGAAAGGADLADIAGLAAEIRARTASPDRDLGDGFAGRGLRLGVTFGGAGRLEGDLSASCTAALSAVLDALGSKTSPEDTRTRRQRRHDSLEEACRRLIAADCLPARAGQPTRIQLHMTLDQLRHLPDPHTPGSPSPSNPDPGRSDPGSAAFGEPAFPAGDNPPGRSGAHWPPAPATAAGPPPRWPAAPPGADCDATIIPVVSGHLDTELLNQLLDRTGPHSDLTPQPEKRANLTRHGPPTTRPPRHGPGTSPAEYEPPGPSPTGHRPLRASPTGYHPPKTSPSHEPPKTRPTGSRPRASSPTGTPADAARRHHGHHRERERAREQRAGQAERDLILNRALDLLSGPSGLAAWLRTSRLDGIAASASLPLDTGAATDTIPAHLRRAVTTRDQHCRFPGCTEPPAACQIHHVIPRHQGGPTRLRNLALLCAFHHLIAVHRWGWALALHPDGEVTATSPDGSRTHRTRQPRPSPES